MDRPTDETTPAVATLPEEKLRFYRRTLETLNLAEVPFLVAGAFALNDHTGIHRRTKDFDLFVRGEDEDRVLAVLAAAGCRIERLAPHWLSKAWCGDDFVDIIHSSGNAVAQVDDRWFAHASPAEILGVPVRLCPAEEMIWSKAFIMERERYDGADVAHLLHDCSDTLDWARLLERFGDHWRVLLAHLVLFAFVYPQRRAAVPEWVMEELLERLRREQAAPPPELKVCRGTLLSRTQFVVDVEERGYRDGRLPPQGNMSRDDVEHWQRLAAAEEAASEAAAKAAEVEEGLETAGGAAGRGATG
jgi:hypothetical protein